MTRPGCGKKTKSGKHRKHTPIRSERQRRLFGAKASGRKTKAKGLTKKEAKKHLKEMKGKILPEKVKPSKRRRKRKKR